MYALQFEADVENYTIKIPKKFADLESKHLKIFVVEIEHNSKKLPEGFFEPITVDSYKQISKREEIYER